MIKAKRIRKNLSTSTILKAAVMATPAVLAIAASPARAANVYWDINGTTAGGSNATNATGAWDGTNAFWNTDAAGGAGTFGATVGAGNVGVFYAGSNTVAAGNVTGASTITVTGTQAASGLNFFTGTTTLTGGTIDFGGSAGTITMTKLPSPTVGGGGTINSVLTGTGGLTVNYVGTNTGGPFITLGAANTYSGNTVIDTRASVAVTNAAAFGTSSTITINGAVAQSGANSGLRLRSVGAMGAGQTLVLTGIGARTGEAQFTSETGNNTWAGNIVLQGPTSGGNNEGVGGLPGISQNAGSTLTITGTISGFATSATVAGNSFAKNGAGTLVLTTAATHVGLTRVFDGYMIIEADAVLGVGGGGAAQPSLGIGGDGNFEANTLMSAVSASARFPIIAFRNNVNYTTNEIIDMGLQSKIENLSGNNTFAGSLRSNQVAGNEIAITSGKLELTNRLYAAAATARTVIKSGPGELLITAANPTTDGVTMVGTTAAPMAQFAMTNTTFQVNDGLFTLGGANGSYPGPINVAPGGVLKLDNTAAANSTRIGGAVTLSGGELRLLGNATTAVNQPASSVSVASFSTISLSTAGASTTLAFPGALTRLNRGTAIIKGVDNTNTFLTLAGEPMFGNSGAAGTADINIGVSAIVENGANTDFMTVGDGSGTGNVRGLTSSEYTLLTTGSTSLVNTKLTGSQSLSSAETKANSVKMEGASTALTIGTGNILMLNSGAVLATGTGQGISGGDLFLGTYVFDPDFGYLPDQTREGVIAVTAGADLTISSAIKSEIGLTKTGTGLLVLTATNSTYAGQTTINAGILGVGHDGSLGAAATPVILNGGTLRGTDNANLNSAREVHLASTVSNVIDVVAGKTMTINGLVKNEAGVTPAPLSKTGSGTLKLTNAGNSYGTTTFGGTKVIGGTVEIADGAALGAQALFLDGGTVHVTANTTLPQILSVGNTSTTTAGFLIDPGVTVVESGVINQTGIYGQTNTNLVIDGGGTFNPTGNNNYASQTIVKGGSILKYTVSQGQGNSAFGVQPGWFTLDNGTIQAVGQVVNSTGTNGLNTLSVNKGITINSGGGTIDLQVGASTSLPYIVTVAGVVTGSGNLTKTGTGSNVLAFTSVNTMTGKVIINQGKITTSAGGTAPLFAAPTSSTPDKIQLASGTTLGFTASASLHANAGITLGGGTPVIDVGSSTVTIGGAITGAASLTRNGTGIAIFSGVSSYTGATNIVGGGTSNSVLRVTTANALPIGTTLNLNALSATGLAVLDLRQDQEVAAVVNSGGVGTVRVTNGAATLRTFTINNAGSNSFNGEITSTLGLTKNGIGALTLSGPLTYTGPTTLLAGTTTINTTVGNTTLAGVVGATGNLTKAGTNNLTVANLNVNDVVVGAGGNLIVKPRGASPLNANNRGVFVNTYNIDPAQGLDFADHDVVVNGSSYTQVRSDVLAAFGGTTGLFSSDSNARSGATILALFDNSLVGATDWLGVPISPTATVGKYTFFGDANIDGQVTGDDYGVIDANLDTTPASGLEWLSGDMNLDGSVTGDDYGVVDANLGSGTTDPFSPGATLSSLSAVPEPGSLTVLVAAGAGMLMRRRRGK